MPNYGTDANAYYLDKYLRELDEAEDRERFKIDIEADYPVLQTMIEDALTNFDYEAGVELSEIENVIIDINKKLIGTDSEYVVGQVRVTEIDYDSDTGDWSSAGEMYYFAIASWATDKEMIREL